MEYRKLPCHIAQDLMPSFVDGLTSPETNRAMEAHLDRCPLCAAQHRRMVSGVPEPEEQAPQVDYLKKVRKISWRRTIAAVLLAAAALCGGFFLWIFCIGQPAQHQGIFCNAWVNGREIEVFCELSSSGQSIARIRWTESNGVVELTPYLTLVSSVNPSGMCRDTYTAKETIRQVKMGELVLWENGTSITQTAGLIYAAAHPYVGDMSANQELLQATGIQNHLQGLTYELMTSEEPYGWIIHVEEPVASLDDEKQIFDCSLILLAAVEDLEQVLWDYQTEEGQQSYAMSAALASSILGRDIKEYAYSATDVQELLWKLDTFQPANTPTLVKPGEPEG